MCLLIRLSISSINIINREAIGAELSLETGRVVSHWGQAETTRPGSSCRWAELSVILLTIVESVSGTS